MQIWCMQMAEERYARAQLFKALAFWQGRTLAGSFLSWRAHYAYQHAKLQRASVHYAVQNRWTTQTLLLSPLYHHRCMTLLFAH